jgi:hypothetical protein
MAFTQSLTAAEYDEVIPYASLDFANEHAGNHLTYGTYWNQLNDTQKLAALRQATLEFDKLHWEGWRINPNQQQREWPRWIELGGMSTVFYLNERIPMSVAKGCSMQAFYHAKNLQTGHDPAARRDLQRQGVAGIARAGSGEQWNLSKARRDGLCQEAYEEIRHLLAKSGNLGDSFYGPSAGGARF